LSCLAENKILNYVTPIGDFRGHRSVIYNYFERGHIMKKKSFEEIMEEAIKELVEEIHSEDIQEDDVSDGTKEKIEREIWERKRT
jgi:hypothetical protein